MIAMKWKLRTRSITANFQQNIVMLTRFLTMLQVIQMVFIIL